MIETAVDAAALRETVAGAVREATPLGAYADDATVRYLLLVPGRGVRALRVARDRAIPAVSALVPAFAWDEREMLQERGVRFEGLPDARDLRPTASGAPEPVVVQGAALTRVVVGPVHAGVIEPGRFTISSGGESIAHLDAQLGFSHRGIERRVEGREPLALAPLVARICGGCSASRSLAYAHALESLAGVEPEEPVALARLVLAELERIHNHLFDLAVAASAAGWGPGHAHGLKLKERALRLCALAGGHRLLFDAIVPGGVAAGALADRSALAPALHALERRAEAYAATLFDTTSLVARWRGAGILTYDDARTLGAVGPALRASGGTLDVRADAPYGAYRTLRVDARHAEDGDVLARCTVKVAELRDAFALAGDALALLGDRPLRNVPLALPADGSATAVVEGPRGAETVVVALDGGRVARLHVVSASYRTWPAVAHASAAGIVPDFPLVNKSFNLCYACADR